MKAPSTLDDLIALRRLRDEPGFAMVCDRYAQLVARLSERMLSRATGDADALRLRSAIQELHSHNPRKVLDDLTEATDQIVARRNKELGYPPR